MTRGSVPVPSIVVNTPMRSGSLAAKKCAMHIIDFRRIWHCHRIPRRGPAVPDGTQLQELPKDVCLRMPCDFLKRVPLGVSPLVCDSCTTWNLKVPGS